MKSFAILACLLSVLLNSVVSFAATNFPHNYREVSTLTGKMDCAGVIITRYENPKYKFAEYTLPNGNIIFVFVPADSTPKTYLKKSASVEIVSIPFDEAKALYEQALDLPVPGAIPFCTNLPNK